MHVVHFPLPRQPRTALAMELNPNACTCQLPSLKPFCSTFQIGAFAAPDKIHWAPGLPKTRSGKIMRRILRKIASKQLDELGDTSTLADPSVVDHLIELADR